MSQTLASLRRVLPLLTLALVAQWVAPVSAQAQTPITFNTAIATNPNSSYNFPSKVAVGDFNGDGKIDAAVTDGSTTLRMLLGNGDGTFTEHDISLPSNVNSGAIAAADLNGDGKLDLAFTSNGGIGGVTVLLNTGNDVNGVPQFAASQYLPGFGGTRSINIGDLNGDGHPDLVVGNCCGTVMVALNNGDGTFTTGQTLALEPSAGYPSVGFGALGDLNGDGKLDFVMASAQAQAVDIFYGNGDGTFQNAVVYPGNYYSVAVGDLNHDGKQDFVVSTGNGTLAVFMNQGGGNFAAPVFYATGGPYPPYTDLQVVLADLNGDGNLDAVVTHYASQQDYGRGVSVLAGNGDGSFGAPSYFPTGLTPLNEVVADFNGDGQPDIGTVNYGFKNFTVLLNTTVSELPALVITASNGTMSYGGATPTITPSYSGFVSGDGPGSLTTPPVCTTTATSAAAAGSSQTSSCSGAVDARYSISYVSGTVTVNRAPITVTAASPTVYFGALIPSITGTVTAGALFNGDTLSSIGVSCGVAGTPYNAGTYTTSCSGSPANYGASYVNGALTIAPAPQTITFPTLGNQVYNGVPFTLGLNASASSGLAVSYTVSGPATLTGTTLTINSPGAVTVTAAQAGSNNYQAAASVAQTFQAQLGLDYGLYATGTGCRSLRLNGQVQVDSFDSSLGAFPAGQLAAGGNVGTNGTLTLTGHSEVLGSLFDPQGNTQGNDCDRNHAVSLVLHGGNDHDRDRAQLTGGIVGLPAALLFPTPAAPAVAPPTSRQKLGDDCDGFAGCTVVARGHVALAPGTYGSVTVDDRLTVDLSAGIYSFNRLRLQPGAVLNLVSGPVTINLTLQDPEGDGDALDLRAGSIINPGSPSNLVFLYGGRSGIELGNGNGDNDRNRCDGNHDRDDSGCGSGLINAVIYAPNASVRLNGSLRFAGAIVGETIAADGNVTLHYDRSLGTVAAPSGGTPPPPVSRDRDDRGRDGRGR